MGVGIPCPHCKSLDSHVYETRSCGGTILRRRQCVCGTRFNTTESYVGLVQARGDKKKKKVKAPVATVQAATAHPKPRADKPAATPKKNHPPKRRDEGMEDFEVDLMDTREALAGSGISPRFVPGSRY